MRTLHRLAFGIFGVVIGALALGGCKGSPNIALPPPPQPRLFVSNASAGNVVAFTRPFGPANPPNATLALGAAGGIGTDAAGNLYVTDFFRSVKVFSPPVTSASVPAMTIGPISGAFDVANVVFDVSGNLWVTDERTPPGKIYEFTPPLGCSTPALTITSASLNEPTGTVFDSAGDMLVANFGAPNIVVIRPPFTASPNIVATIATPSGCTGNSRPDGFAIDGAGRLFVSDGANGNFSSVPSAGGVIVFRPPFATGSTWAFIIPAPSTLTAARRIAFDSQGDLYVAEADDFTVHNGGLAIYSPPYSSASVPLFTFQAGNFAFAYGVTFAP